MTRIQTLATLGEFGFLDRLLPTLPQRPDVLVGPGDDCAVVRCGTRRVLITTDALVESVHFERAWMTPQQLGRRSLLVNLSDIAAMGGRPTFCVVSVGVPVDYSVRDLSALHAGIRAAAHEAGVAIVGGNVSRADRLFVSITQLGEADRRVVTRAGARASDELFVTGTLGDAALGVRELQRGRYRGPAVTRYREPHPRLTAGALLAVHNIASAMIDISDGLLQDLGHLTAMSKVGAEIDIERLPYSAALRRLPAADRLELALRGGDDYELLCAVPRRRVPALLRLRKRLGCPIARIGRCVPARRGIELLGAGREVHVESARGWDHFKR
jgi:thiamine-monophosphate kinase